MRNDARANAPGRQSMRDVYRRCSAAGAGTPDVIVTRGDVLNELLQTDADDPTAGYLITKDGIERESS